MMERNGRLLTTDELALMLKVSARHIHRQRDAGKFPPPVRIGRCVRWDPEDFRDWGKDSNNKPRGRR